MPKRYDITNWYWYVAGDTTQVYSSASNTFVPVADATFQGWLAKGGVPTNIDSLQSLTDVLAGAGLPAPPGGTTSDAQKEGLFANIPQAVKVWSFAIENRVRVLEGQPQRTAQQFKNYVKGLM